VRFIVDESSGKAVTRYLKGAGHDVLYVGDIIPQADDAEMSNLPWMKIGHSCKLCAWLVSAHAGLPNPAQ